MGNEETLLAPVISKCLPNDLFYLYLKCTRKCATINIGSQGASGFIF
jgi:hypothetical protein